MKDKAKMAKSKENWQKSESMRTSSLQETGVQFRGETLKQLDKLRHVKKIAFKNIKFFQIPTPPSTLKVLGNKSRFKPILFFAPFQLERD